MGTLEATKPSGTTVTYYDTNNTVINPPIADSDGLDCRIRSWTLAFDAPIPAPANTLSGTCQEGGDGWEFVNIADDFIAANTHQGDYDGDGDEDIWMTGYAGDASYDPEIRIYVQENGIYSLGHKIDSDTGGTGKSVSGDVNNDGMMDVIWTHVNNTTEISEALLFLGNADLSLDPTVLALGSFSLQDMWMIGNYEDELGNGSIQLRHMNGDSYLDLIISTGAEAAVLIGDGLGGFSIGGQFGTTGLCDLGTSNAITFNHTLLLQDIDTVPDGDLDLIFMSGESLCTAANNGDGTFAPMQYHLSPWGEFPYLSTNLGFPDVFQVDIDLDGELDIVIDDSWNNYTGLAWISVKDGIISW